MGFYGNLTAPLKTKFEFDRIYSSKVVMDAKANEDEVFVGRFVLVNYEHYDYLWVKDNEVYMDRNCTIKPKSNAFVIGQTFINGFTNSFLWCEEVGKFPRIGATATTINAEIALDDIYNFNLWLDTKSEYCKDFVIKRNYHQTVWQKVYNDQLGKQQYVLIADLGAGLATENYDGLMSKEDKRIMNSNSRIFNVNHMYSTLTQKQQKNIKDYDLTTIGGPSFNEELSFDLSTAVKMLHCMFVEKEWHLKLEGADIYSNGVKEWKVGDVIIFKGKEKVVKNNKDIFVWETWKLVNIYGSGKEDEWYKDPNNWIRITGECLVNTSNDGLMSKEDKVKLDGTPRLFNINSIYLDSELMQEELSIGINLERALELLNNWLSENADSLQIGDEIYFKTDEIQNKGSNITYKVWSHYRWTGAQWTPIYTEPRADYVEDNDVKIDGLMAWYDKKIFDKNRIFNLNVLIGEKDYEGHFWELGYAQPALKDYLTNNLGLDYKKGDNLIFKNADGNWEHYVLMDVNRVTHSDAWARVNFDPYHLVTQNEDGLMLKEDKKKLDSISVLSDGSAAINSDIKVTSGNMGGFAPSFAIVHDYGGHTSGISFYTNDSSIFNFNMTNERSVTYNSNIRTGIITTKMYDWETTVPNENNEQYKDENGISLNSGTELKRQYVKIPVIFSEQQKMPNTNYIVLVSYVGYKPSYDISIDTNGKTTDGFNIVIGRADTTSINLLTLHWLVIPYQKNDTNVEPIVYYE